MAPLAGSAFLQPVDVMHPLWRITRNHKPFPKQQSVGQPRAASARGPKACSIDAITALIEPWQPVLDLLNVSRLQAYDLAERALSNGTAFLQEWLMAGGVSDTQVFRAIARHLGLVFLPAIATDRLVLREQQCLTMLQGTLQPRVVPMARAGGRLAFVMAHTDLDIAALRQRIACYPALAERLHIAAPSALRTALMERCDDRLLEDAQHALFRRQPEFSARLVANAWQGALAAATVLVLLWGIVFAPLVTIAAINVLASVAFPACVLLRLFAVKGAGPLRLPPVQPADAATMPVYSVLVALRKEKDVLPQLLVALGKLQWPRAKLEIKLVCERDDEETLSVLKAMRLRPNIEIVEVPPAEPRTKPKALAYALALCRGELVTLYDAEDRPHPLQLLEAWQRFEQEGDDFACLQAPLVVTNIEQSALARVFGFEYASLFRGLLPWLARSNLVTPLGGTSNHFRMSALRKVGGWDPYNVTEDADLGLRLRRFGYRTGMLAYPTFEDAPEDVQTWMPQRVRWFKGWLQTWLVHMREPGVLRQEIGLRNFLVAQVLYLGMIVSAMVHPIVLATLLVSLARVILVETSSLEAGLLILASVSVACGYGAFIALGGVTLARPERKGFWKVVALTPLYWVLLSVAAWRSIWEIYRRPHHWNKTPHQPARRVALYDAPMAQGAPMIAGSSAPMASRSRPS